MTNDEIISGLKDLEREVKTHIQGDEDFDKVFKYDIEVLRAARIKVLNEKHGYWMGTVCTACGSSVSFWYECGYCPVCGAKMDG